jgi:hypothetical protein
MATGANKQHWLSLPVRSRGIGPVRCLLLLLMLGGPAAPTLASAHLLSPAHTQSEREETEAGEKATTTASRVCVARARQTRDGLPLTLSGSLLLRSALTHSRQFDSARPVGAFARRDGPGISMRC